MISSNDPSDNGIGAGSKYPSHELSESLHSTKFRVFCAKYDVDIKIAEEAWIDFERVSGSFAIEGDKVYWFLVAVYITWKSSKEFYKNYNIDVLKIINGEKIKLFDFIQKSSKWVIMNWSGDQVKSHLDGLLSSYSLALRLFCLYCEKFCCIFEFPPVATPVDTNYNKRKQRKRKCNSNELFHFIWTFFIVSKRSIFDNSDEFISLIHLLLCCLQLCFTAVVSNDEIKACLVNPSFSGLSESHRTSNSLATDIPQLAHLLFPCEAGEFISDYSRFFNNEWVSFTNKLASYDGIKAITDGINNFFEPDIFSYNLHKLNRIYSDMCSKDMWVDERHFVHSAYNDASFNAVSTEKVMSVISFCRHRSMNRKSEEQGAQEVATILDNTMVDQMENTGLQAILTPSLSKLSETVSLHIGPDALDVLMVKSLFVYVYDRLKSDSGTSFAATIVEMLFLIYQSLLISIVSRERHSHSDRGESIIYSLLNRRDFHLSIICASLEVYLCSRDNAKAFPWSVNLLEIDSFCFFKVIELIVISETKLRREVVKHFGHLEEKIVNLYAWEGGSSLYECIRRNNGVVPTLNDVAFPSFCELSVSRMEPCFNRGSYVDQNLSFNNQAEPKSKNEGCSSIPSLSNLYNDDVQKKLTSATRNLFMAHQTAKSDIISGGHSQPTQASSKPPVILVTSHHDKGGGWCSPDRMGSLKVLCDALENATAAPRDAFDSRLSPVTPPSTAGNAGARGCRKGDVGFASPSSPMNVSVCQQQLGPLPFFMRKVYYLASYRLKSLCDFLAMQDDLKSRCWTCVEHILLKETDMLVDHRLDHMILCSVYAVGKLSTKNWSFNEILRWYRTQPYFDNTTYREVPLNRYSSLQHDDHTTSRTDPKGSWQCGDLIAYYNEVFLVRLNTFINHLREDQNDCSVQLSPLPNIKNTKLFNQQKITADPPIYVSPKKPVAGTPQRFKPLYCFENSPIRLADRQTTPSKASPGTKRRTNIEDLDIGSVLYCTTPIKLSKL